MKPTVFLFLFLLLAASAFAGRPDIVRDTCEKCAASDPNVNYTLCVDALGAVPKSHRAGLRVLGVIAARLAAANATGVESKVRRLMDSHRRDAYLASCLESCLDLYSDSASRLNDTVGAIRDRRYGDANVWISAAVDTPGECEEGFRDEGMESPITEENDVFFGLAVIALSIVAMLQGHVH